MANLKDLIVNGAARIIGKTYSSEFVGNVTGNVTGNVSGSSGSCTGNAATSSKLKTAVSLTTTDGTNTSTGVNFDGSAATSIKLPTTIKATFSGNLTGNVTGNVSGSSGSCTGNAKTATTADKTAYGISVKDAASNLAVNGWNGSATGSLTIAGTSPVTTTATANTITVTHDKKGPSTTAATSKGDTSNQAPGFGGTFKVTSATVDVYGHTTALAEHTVTIPSTAASTSASGIVTTGTQAFNGAKTFADTTDSTNNTSGAVIVSGGLGVAKNIYAAAVHNAVWNDLVDCMEVPEDTSLEFGYCYSWEGDSVIKSSRSSKNCIGIHSNTAGFVMGEKKTKTIQAAVAGFVLAYVDKLYPEGTPLTWGDDGTLTKCSLLKRVLHPERIIATFYKEEKEEKWHNLPVSGRHWVKVV